MDETEEIAEEGSHTVDLGPADPPATEPARVDEGSAPESEPEDASVPAADRKPGLYVLRPQGLRPAPRSARRRLGRLRNDCPPDRRRPSNRPALKPRIR